MSPVKAFIVKAMDRASMFDNLVITCEAVTCWLSRGYRFLFVCASVGHVFPGFTSKPD